MDTTDELAVYARVRAEMDRLIANKGVPRDIEDFLINQWSRLMTGIYMAHGDHDADWRAGWETADALVQSLRPQQGAAQTEQYLRDLPVLLLRLHEGCVALSLDPQQRDTLFARLAMLHAAVARDGLQPNQSGVVTHIGEIEDPLVGWRRRFGFSKRHPAEGQAHTNQPTKSGSGLTELAIGDQVGFIQNGVETVLILTGRSPMGGMYLFTNKAGLGAKTYTHARLADKFRRGEARLVS